MVVNKNDYRFRAWGRALCFGLCVLSMYRSSELWAFTDDEKLQESIDRLDEISDPTLKSLHDFWDSRVEKLSQQQSTLRMAHGPYILPILWTYAGKDRVFPSGRKELDVPSSAGDLAIVSRDSADDKLAEIYEIILPSITWIKLTEVFSNESWNPNTPLAIRNLSRSFAEEVTSIDELIAEGKDFFDESDAAHQQRLAQIERELTLKRRELNNLWPQYTIASNQYESNLKAQRQQNASGPLGFKDLTPDYQRYLTELDRAMVGAYGARYEQLYRQKEQALQVARAQLQAKYNLQQGVNLRVAQSKSAMDAQWAQMAPLQNEISTLESRKYNLREFTTSKIGELRQRYQKLGQRDPYMASDSQLAGLRRRLAFDSSFSADSTSSYWTELKELQEKLQALKNRYDQLNQGLLSACNCVRSSIPDRLVEARYVNYRTAYIELASSLDFNFYRLFLKAIEARKRVREESRARR